MDKVSIQCSSVGNIRWTDLSSQHVFDNKSISLFRIRISSHLPALARLQKLLQQDEHTRASRYHQQKDHDRFIISRGLLRIIAGKFISLPPSEIIFVKGENKKPFIKNSDQPVFYNVAHAGDFILISIGENETGVDVEFLNDQFDYKEILEHSFSAPEIAFIQSSLNPLSSFYILWTRKESLLKATAKGITEDLVNTPSLDGLHKVSPEIIGSTKNWDIYSFEISSDHTGSIACPPLSQTRFFSVEASFSE